jgi:beta-N-acetylhexosaminidase
MFERTGKPENLRKNKPVVSSSSGVLERLRFRRIQRLGNSGTRRAAIILLFVFFLSTAFPKPPQQTWTDKMLKSLSLREKIAQLVQIRVPGKFVNRESPEFRAIRGEIRQNKIGGVVLFAGNVYESAVLLNELQTISKLPLLVAADFERGASFRIADTTSFPWTMALGASGSEQLAYQQGLITAQEARALGVHWIFAPVMDVNNNPDNPVINIRSFGEDPQLVARLGSAFIRGAKRGGVLTTAKHFPGHGDTLVDSHMGLPVVESDMDRLQSIEFAPFRSAIEAGVDSIMTAHVAVPRVTGEPEVPATLSSKILTDILQNTLNFRGLIVTDALEMAGITNHYWCGLAAIRAIQAGADVLLLPPDTTVAINEVERAVRRGDISELRIDRSVCKVLEAKRSLGLHRNRVVPLNRIGKIVASPQSIKSAQEIADRSITVFEDERHLLPINPAGDTRIFSLVLTSDLESSPGSIFQTEICRRFPSIRTAWINARTAGDLSAAIDAAVSQSDLIVCSTLARLNAGQDAASIPESQREIVEKLSASGKPMIWVAFGSPYVLRFFPRIGTYVCTFSYSDVSQVAAAKALAGEIAITGRMPVSIPGYTKAGDGLQIPKLEMTLKRTAPEALGLSKNAFQNAEQLLMSFVEEGVFPGAQLLAGYQGSIVLESACGKISHAAGSADVSPDTIYDISSLSGIIGAASAAMLATKSGSLIPDAPVRDYMPELKISEKLRIADLVEDLLEAFSGRGNPEKAGTYSSADLLENIISRASGLPFYSFLGKHLFEPLGMKHTFRNPPRTFPAGIARQATAGSDTLFCNAQDLAIFSQMLLNRGIYNHRRYFDPKTVDKLTGIRGAWSKPSDSDWIGGLFSPGAFGHSSPGGSFLWIDPAKKLFVVLLTNGRQEDARVPEAQRRIVESLVTALSD